MIRSFHRAAALGCLFLLSPLVSEAEELKPLNPGVRRFINHYCVECHGPEKDKGDRVLHEFPIRKRDGWVVDAADIETVTILEDVLDQLNLGEMPPDKKDVKQPSPEEIRSTTKWLTKFLLTVEEGSGGEEVAMRRLNRREYRNTIRDLLGLGELAVDPTETFPADEIDEGFTNLGEALNLTDAHLGQYLDAAESYLEMAFHFGKAPPEKTIRFAAEDWGYPVKEAMTPWMYRLHTPGKYLDIGAGKKQLSDNFDLGTYPKPFARRGGIQTPGYYRIEIKAEAIRRLTHPYDPDMIPVDLTPPMQLALYVANGTEGLSVGGVNARHKLAMWDLKDHQAESFEKTVWLDKGAIPFLNWDNGPGPSDYWMRDILAKYHDDIEFRGKQGSHAWHIIGKNAVPGRLVSDVWQGPVMRVHQFAFAGPLEPTFSSKAQREFFGDAEFPNQVNLEEALLKFTRKAFRRPVTKADVAPYLRIARQSRQDLGRSGEESLRTAFKAVLVSPDFLYLKESSGGGTTQLNAHELANRLAYFLWSSMPDEELFQLADSGELLNPPILRAQALRMMADTRSDAFVEGLAESWLRLDKLGSMPPDTVKFQEYYRNGLEDAMRQETLHFLSHMKRENRPIREFLSSDYAFLNQDLARHYGINDVEGSHFRKVSLPEQSPRGGLLGQGSILTLSANGVDTSPVVRGIWVLENLLGTPPPPPPPDVEPLDPDVRGTTTIRQRLEKHRSVEACADCHAKIDPFGFPLEFFDPVGAFRPTYFKNRRWSRLERTTILVAGRPVDGFAKLPSGEQFKDPIELKQVLLGREEQVLRALAEKLLTYATGRKMSFRDQQQIDLIVDTASITEDHGFRDLLLAITRSKTFAHR